MELKETAKKKKRNEEQIFFIAMSFGFPMVIFYESIIHRDSETHSLGDCVQQKLE